jgi:chaperonin GroES
MKRGLTIKQGQNNMKLRPLADRVIVRQNEAEEKTKSGIVLPDTAKEKPTKGKVIAVGPGKFDDNGKRMEIGVRNGDTVYYGKYSGTDVEVDGQKFVILRESDILGVLE